MAATKRHVLAEIKRLADANGGPPGKRLFERETGIREADWYPSLWLRWGDALQEAGYDRNKMVEVVRDDVLVERYALLAQRLGRLPIQGELIREAKVNPSFPGEKSYRRFGGKASLVRAVASFCKTRESLSDVAAMCAARLRAGDTPEDHEQKIARRICLPDAARVQARIQDRQNRVATWCSASSCHRD